MNISQVIFTALTSLLALFSSPTSYTEGLVGQPQNIHPLFCQENGVDYDLVALTFEGLVRNDVDGNIVPGLAQSWEISEDKKTYVFKLDPESCFHDGRSVTAQDVLFTASKSPQFKNVKIEEVDPQTVKISLETSFAPLLELLVTLGIIPKHMEGRMNPLYPVGAGPYKIEKIERGTRKVESVVLAKFKNSRPGPEKIVLKFFESEKDLETAAKLGEIDAFASLDSALSNFASQKVSLRGRYFSLVFNLNGLPLLKDVEFRKTLAGLTDRGAIVAGPLGGNGAPVYGPLQGTWVQADVGAVEYSPEPQKPWEGELRLVFPDSEIHAQAVDILKASWEKSGITVVSQAVSPDEIKNRVLPEKDFDVVLIGQEVGRDPDRYTLWHSAQTELGQNFSGYKNMRADRALEEGRKEHDPEKRKEHYKNFQTIFAEDLPAIFLYRPVYNYHLKKIKDRGLNLEGIFVPGERWERVLEMYR